MLCSRKGYLDNEWLIEMYAVAEIYIFSQLVYVSINVLNGDGKILLTAWLRPYGNANVRKEGASNM